MDNDFPVKLSILNRPDRVRHRQEFEHWECDLVMFCKEFGKANVTSLVERVSSFTVALKERRQMISWNSFITNLEPLPQTVGRSITF